MFEEFQANHMLLKSPELFRVYLEGKGRAEMMMSLMYIMITKGVPSEFFQYASELRHRLSMYNTDLIRWALLRDGKGSNHALKNLLGNWGIHVSPGTARELIKFFISVKIR